MCLKPIGKHYPPMLLWKSRLPSLSLCRNLSNKNLSYETLPMKCPTEQTLLSTLTGQFKPYHLISQI